MASESRTSSKTSVSASRRSFDGAHVDFWSDGAVTVGDRLHGRVVARKVAADVARVVADDVCLYDAGEVKALIAAARKANGDRAEMRRRANPEPKPVKRGGHSRACTCIACVVVMIKAGFGAPVRW